MGKRAEVLIPSMKGACMSRVFSVLVLLTVSTAVFAADGDSPTPNRRQLANVEQTKELTDSFLSAMVTGRTYEAFGLIRNVVPDSETIVETWRANADQLLAAVRQEYGRPLEHELLDTKKLGTSFVRYDYLLKFEYSALWCRIIYYRGRNTWIPVFLNFDRDLDPLFTELGK
jgi:hypothetical protein